jgi:uncharacterized OB-fold protein
MPVSPVKVWRKQKKLSKQIGLMGKIVSFTCVRVAPVDYIPQAPYPVVIVELTNKERMIGQLVDYEEADLKIGREVVTVIRRVRTEEKEEVIPYVIKFRPV